MRAGELGIVFSRGFLRVLDVWKWSGWSRRVSYSALPSLPSGLPGLERRILNFEQPFNLCNKFLTGCSRNVRFFTNNQYEVIFEPNNKSYFFTYIYINM